MSGKEPAMEAERFAALADAYGGQLQRWPLAERASAQRFAATAAGRAILRRAGMLDSMLDSYRIAAPGPALHAAALRAAELDVVRQRRRRVWWLGLGLAGVGLAGVAAGLATVTIVTPEVQPEHYVLDANATAFGDVGPDADTAEEDI